MPDLVKDNEELRTLLNMVRSKNRYLTGRLRMLRQNEQDPVRQLFIDQTIKEGEA